MEIEGQEVSRDGEHYEAASSKGKGKGKGKGKAIEEGEEYGIEESPVRLRSSLKVTEPIDMSRTKSVTLLRVATTYTNRD